MTEKQERFVEEFLVDLNGAAAARRAGYSEKSAKQQASLLLKQAAVRQAVANAKAERSERTGIRQEQVLLELGGIAFAEASDASGAEVKLGSKLRALELLGKHLGMFDGGAAPEQPVTILEDV